MFLNDIFMHIYNCVFAFHLPTILDYLPFFPPLAGPFLALYCIPPAFMECVCACACVCFLYIFSVPFFFFLLT